MNANVKNSLLDSSVSRCQQNNEAKPAEIFARHDIDQHLFANSKT